MPPRARGTAATSRGRPLLAAWPPSEPSGGSLAPPHLMTQIPGYIIYQEPPRRPLTARNLADYALCPQKFLLSFFVSRAAYEHFQGGSAALQHAARAALLDCYRQGGPAQVSVTQLLEWFEQHWEGTLCADGLEEEQLHRRGQEMLRRYHQAQTADSASTVALDLRMEADLGEHRFVSVVDYARRAQDQPLTLLRFRTTRQVPGPRKLGQEASIALMLLVGEAHFGEPAQAGVYGLHPGKLVVAELGEGERAAWREQFRQQATTIRRARDYPTVVGRHCSVCRCRSLCPYWHPPLPAEDRE